MIRIHPLRKQAQIIPLQVRISRVFDLFTPKSRKQHHTPIPKLAPRICFTFLSKSLQLYSIVAVARLALQIALMRELLAFKRNTDYTTRGRGCRRRNLQTSNRGSSIQSSSYSTSQSTLHQSTQDNLDRGVKS